LYYFSQRQRTNACIFKIQNFSQFFLSNRLEYTLQQFKNRILVPFQGGVNKFYHGIRGFEDEPLLLLPMNPGDTVFFHPLIIHGSGANVTQVILYFLAMEKMRLKTVFGDSTGIPQGHFLSLRRFRVRVH
jgi:hypothetical protein